MPAPADFFNNPAFTNIGAGSRPSLTPTSDWKSQVPLLWMMAPAPMVRRLVLVQVVSASVRVRWFRVLDVEPDIERSPCTVRAPVPEIVPPDHVIAPVTVTPSDPVIVPPEWTTDGTTIGPPLSRVSVPAERVRAPIAVTVEEEMKVAVELTIVCPVTS